MVGSFPILDMVVGILSHPMMHLVLTTRTGTHHWLSTKTDTRPALHNSTVCIDRDQIASIRQRGPNSSAINL